MAWVMALERDGRAAHVHPAAAQRHSVGMQICLVLSRFALLDA